MFAASDFTVLNGNIGATEITYEVRDLKPAKTYQFMVSAVNALGEGPSSSPTSPVTIPAEGVCMMCVYRLTSAVELFSCVCQNSMSDEMTCCNVNCYRILSSPNASHWKNSSSCHRANIHNVLNLNTQTALSTPRHLVTLNLNHNFWR